MENVQRAEVDPNVYNVRPAVEVPINEQVEIPKADLGEIDRLPFYSIRNGNPEDVVPYLLRGSIPTRFHWVPVNGIAPAQAITCVDAYIRSAIHQLSANAPATPVAGEMSARNAGILLGTARAVMTALYEIRSGDLVAAETAAPVVHATVGTDGAVRYRCLLAASDPARAALTAQLVLTDDEKVYVKTVLRCAQAVIPLQGLNLMNDGHHYLSDRSKSSYKAFLAVEKQIWVAAEFRELLRGSEAAVQDILWHKAGHPVSVAIKESCATSVKVKENLKAAKLGSAATRLPALESDLKAAQTFMKVADAVGPIWKMFGGSMDSSLIRDCLAALEAMPIGSEAFLQPRDVGIGVEVSNREDVLKELRRIISMSTDEVAFGFGFYCSMVERTATEGGVVGADTLRGAFSLRKLMNECRAAFSMGADLYKDYMAVKARARETGTLVFPRYVLGVATAPAPELAGRAALGPML